MGLFGEKRKLEVICLLKRTCSPPTVLIVVPPSSDFSEFEAYDALEIISSAGMIAEMQIREYFFFLSRYIISRVAGYKTRYKSTRESKSQLVNFWLMGEPEASYRIKISHSVHTKVGSLASWSSREVWLHTGSRTVIGHNQMYI